MTGCSYEACSRPHLANGWCRLHYERIRRAGTPDLIEVTAAERQGRVLASKKRYRDKNPEKVMANRAQYRQDDRAHNAGRRHNLKRFGLTIEDYDAMHAQQGGLCAICGEEETVVVKGRLSKLRVDHNHDTGAVRQLLCNTCNLHLGLLLEDKEWTMKALAYLNHHGITLEKDEAPKGAKAHRFDEENAA